MKTLPLVLAVPLMFATACEAAVPGGPDASASGDVDASTSGDPTTAAATTEGLPRPSTTDPTTTGETIDLPGSSSTDASAGTATSEASSTTGREGLCDSPLLDSEDRLQLIDAPMRGNPDALVTLVVWSGYADPFSRSLQTTLAALAEGPLGDAFRIVSKQFPLSFQDPEGVFARAGLAAHELGMYWPFHDAMFASEETLDLERIDAIAVEVGLDLEAFHDAMESPEVAARLEEDATLFVESGGIGTPFSILNGLAVPGAQTETAFEDIIVMQRDAMEVLIDQGIPPCVAFEQRLDEQLP